MCDRIAVNTPGSGQGRRPRLRSVTASFSYDPFGRRTQKTVAGTSTTFLYDGANVAQEVIGGTNTANLLSGGIDEVFTRTDTAGTSNFLGDALGSTVALTDGSGNLSNQYTYEPFGNASVTGSVFNPYQYTGRENDGTGLLFYRARYYNPQLQRFISEDPIGYQGNTVNLYEYAYDNPTDLIDPSGEQGIFILLEAPPLIPPELLSAARDVASPKESLPLPDGGRLDLGPSDPNLPTPEHYVKGQGPVPTPHVHDPLPPFDEPYSNIPRGLNPDPRPATPIDFIKAILHNIKPVFPFGLNPMPGRKPPKDNANLPPDICGGNPLCA